MPSHNELIVAFYTAMQNRDVEAMVACYGAQPTFSDPAFGLLRGAEVADMWRMLLGRATDFSVRLADVNVDERSGTAHWIASYTFSRTGRKVVNDVHAYFEFADGRIARHVDHFNFWRWMRQAFGVKGLLFGWTPLMQRIVRKQALAALVAFRASTAR